MHHISRYSTLARALLFLALAPASHAQSWPEVFNPMEVKTLNFQLDPAIWEDIKRDTNFYDKELNIRVPVLMWADGEEPITVQIRRKSSPPATPCQSTTHPADSDASASHWIEKSRTGKHP